MNNIEDSSEEIDLKDAKLDMKVLDENNKKSFLYDWIDEIKKWFSVRLNLYIFIGVVSILVLLIIVLAVTIKPSSINKETYPLDSRINCIPWIQSIDESIIQNECNKNLNCIYQKSNNETIPSCFYDKNSYKLKLIESKETELGDTYLFSDSLKQIRIDFEYLDNEVVRFKVI